jgi:hypothetical protein
LFLQEREDVFGQLDRGADACNHLIIN